MVWSAGGRSVAKMTTEFEQDNQLKLRNTCCVNVMTGLASSNLLLLKSDLNPAYIISPNSASFSSF